MSEGPIRSGSGYLAAGKTVDGGDTGRFYVFQLSQCAGRYPAQGDDGQWRMSQQGSKTARAEATGARMASRGEDRG